MSITIPCQSIWENQATRTVKLIKSNDFTRMVTCFEVLDYDSLTYVQVDDAFVHVVGMIYKKVTIEHKQYRRYSLLPDVPGSLPSAPPVAIDPPQVTGPYTNPDETNLKDTKMESRPVWYYDSVPAADYHDHSGTRKVEYRLYLLYGTTEHRIELGELTIGAYGRYELTGTNKQVIEGTGPVEETGPEFTVEGNRLYGVSINVGKKACTYSFDVEEYLGGFNELAIDSPINVEDYNSYWRKTKRVVGAINYYGFSDSKNYPYTEGDAGTAGTSLPNTVMAVGYMDTRR